MAEADPNVLIKAILFLAKTRGREWLVTELERVTLAMIAGEVTIKSLAFEGGSATGDRELPVAFLVDIFTRALEQLDGSSTADQMTLSPRFGPYGIPH